jgi:hypothetical protein
MHQNVLVANGAAFFPGEGYPAMRLNFSHTPEEIQIGMKILGQLSSVYCERLKYRTPLHRAKRFPYAQRCRRLGYLSPFTGRGLESRF